MCDCCRSPVQVFQLPTTQLHTFECWTPRTTQSWRNCDRQTTRATTTSSCPHHHSQSQSQELVRTTSPLAACCKHDTANGCCSPCSFLSSPQSIRIETLLRELLDVCIEDETTCECVCERYHERCNTCEPDRQSLVCELMDVVERLRASEQRYGSCVRCRPAHGRSRGCGADGEVSTETQTLFEVLFRITTRETYRGSSRSRPRGGPGCFEGRGRGRDAGLSRVVKLLLDELESAGGCECHPCREYVEANSRRVEKALGEIEGDCGERQDRCRCGFASAHAGADCSGCAETGTKVRCETPGRRSRGSNVHVGFSVR